MYPLSSHGKCVPPIAVRLSSGSLPIPPALHHREFMYITFAMDKIFITELRADTVIGINDWERSVRQRVTVDLEMATDIRQAAATDDIQFALNYKVITDRLVNYISGSQFELLESLAEGIAEILTKEFSVSWVKITLHKPGALSATKDVGIIIERSAD